MGICGQPLSEALGRRYNSRGMSIKLRTPGSEMGAHNRAQGGAQRQGTLGAWRRHLPIPLAKRGTPLTCAPPPGSCGQRGELGDTSKSLSSSASPSARRRLQGPGGGHGCSMSRGPRPYNLHCQRTWRERNLLRGASRPSRPGPLPRIPPLAAMPTHTPRQPGPQTAEEDGLAWRRHFLFGGGVGEAGPGACGKGVGLGLAFEIPFPEAFERCQFSPQGTAGHVVSSCCCLVFPALCALGLGRREMRCLLCKLFTNCDSFTFICKSGVLRPGWAENRAEF